MTSAPAARARSSKKPGREQVVRDHDPAPSAPASDRAAATASGRRGSAAERNPDRDVASGCRGEPGGHVAAVVDRATVARPGDGEHDPVVVAQARLVRGVAAARPRAGRRGRGRRRARPAESVSASTASVRSTCTWYPAESSSGTTTAASPGSSEARVGGHVGLLDVDVSEPHRRRGIRMPLRHRRGHGVVQAAHRTTALLGRGAVRDAHERRRMLRHPPMLAPAGPASASVAP